MRTKNNNAFSKPLFSNFSGLVLKGTLDTICEPRASCYFCESLNGSFNAKDEFELRVIRLHLSHLPFSEVEFLIKNFDKVCTVQFTLIWTFYEYCSFVFLFFFL